MRTQKDRGKQGPLKKSVKQKVLESTLKTIKGKSYKKLRNSPQIPTKAFTNCDAGVINMSVKIITWTYSKVL